MLGKYPTPGEAERAMHSTKMVTMTVVSKVSLSIAPFNSREGPAVARVD